MPSKEFLIASRDAYQQRAQVAEKQHRIAHAHADVLMKFIKKNCTILEVSEKTAMESKNVSFLQIDDVYYLVEPEIKERLN